MRRPPAGSAERINDQRALAVALKYAPGDSAPRVVAKGRGLIADAIIARAHEHGVYVHESRELVTLLQQVDLDEHIPPALYIVIAELLAWLYQVEQNADNSLPPPPFEPKTAIPPAIE